MAFCDKITKALSAPLDPKNVKPPAPGKHGEYIEGWRVIDEANRIFDFDGWTRETFRLEETNRELLTLKDRDGKEYQQWRVGYLAMARIMVGGVRREGTGFGSGASKPENLSDAIESAAKEAETDAMKRALMTFGNPFGLALYDKTKANVQAPPIEYISDDQRDEIAAIASGAGVTLPAICAAAKIRNLKELPVSSFESVVKKLRLTIEQNAEKRAA